MLQMLHLLMPNEVFVVQGPDVDFQMFAHSSDFRLN